MEESVTFPQFVDSPQASVRWNNIKRSTPFFVACAFFCIALALGFNESNTVSQFSRISLRYSTPLPGDTAYRARQHSAENMDAFWPTFWREENTTISTGRNAVDVNSILFSGEAFLAWPAVYIMGTAPSSIDGVGIAVSETLARNLWGSTDIIGMGVYVNNEPRVIRGVFNGSFELALVSFHIEDTSQHWTAAELSGGHPSPTRSDAESYAVNSGLGRPDNILMGGARVVSVFMSFFPLLIPVVYAVLLFVRYVKKFYPMAGTPLFFGGLILFAILVPILLNTLPPWLIPTRWSDFGFWGTQVSSANEALREFISINPLMRDVELRIHLLRQAGFMLAATCSGLFMCFGGASLTPPHPSPPWSRPCSCGTNRKGLVPRKGS